MKTSRLDRVVRGMEKIGLSQALVTATESVYYLTGLWIAPGERLLALLIDPKGCKLFVNHMFQAPKVEGLELVEFDDADDSVAALASRVAPGRLGVDKAWPSRFLLSLMEKRPDVHPVNGSAPVDEARMLKDREEIEALRISSHMNDRVTGLLRQRLAEGETELDAARRYGELGALEGASGLGFEPLICFGAGCAEPHHATGKARLQKGDAVILDVGLNVDHALSDMTRTVFFGGATDEQKRVYEIVKAANAAGKAKVAPGVPLSEIDRAARSVIEQAGYGPNFLHRTGHGLGLEVHEPPDVSPVSPAIAQPGMVFSIEPGVYLPGKFGVRIEDLVLVTEGGCEVLNDLDRDFMIV
jgi:Xaa-Pro dipeptidase